MGYEVYAILIFTISFISIIWEIYQLKLNENQLRYLTESRAIDYYFVLRDYEIVKIPSEFLVAGDVVLLDSNFVMANTIVPCDLILIEGQCLVDESCLTGESLPQLKVQIEHHSHGQKHHAGSSNSHSHANVVSANVVSANDNLINSGHNHEVQVELDLDLDKNRNNILFSGSAFLQLSSKNMKGKRSRANSRSSAASKYKDFKNVSRNPSAEILNTLELLSSTPSSPIPFSSRASLKSLPSSASFSKLPLPIPVSMALPLPQPFVPAVTLESSSHIHIYEEPEEGESSLCVPLSPSKDSSAFAIVLSTGFSTSKGDLFKSILFPTEMHSKMEQDSISFLSILGVVAILAFINKFVNGYIAGRDITFTFLTSLDLITIAVPPALPLILTVGISFSLKRLKLLNVYCIDPARLHYAGRMDTMCWDKTGTITVSELGFNSVHRANHAEMDSIQDLEFVDDPNMDITIEKLMIVCHGVAKPNGQGYIGHALDIELFKVTGWEIENTENHHYDPLDGGTSIDCVAKISKDESAAWIVKRFEFDSHLQRSAVVAVWRSLTLMLYVKGSPESIKLVCTSVPPDYDMLCAKYYMQGYYVIACAAKKIHLPPTLILSQPRAQLEKDLEFVGFLLFENPIKKQAFGTFAALAEADIQSIIITGDAALTAIHVSRQLDIVKSVVLVGVDEDGLYGLNIEMNSQDWVVPRKMGIEIGVEPYLDDGYTDFAITGQALMILQNTNLELLHAILRQTRIFSRAKPDQKTFIIEWLIKQGKFVGMCGDGTNDCGALKAAHVGMALSSTEASIVAPFTSGQKQISDIVSLVQEGRCSLETAFVGFKFMIVYPLIQLMISATLNQFGATLSGNQYLMDDLMLVTALALFALYTRPKTSLSRSRPVDTLFSKEIVGSLLAQLFLCVFFFLINAIVGFNTEWFCSVAKATSQLGADFMPLKPIIDPRITYPCYPIDADLDTQLTYLLKSHENTILWNFARFQYVIVIFAFSVVSKYRLSFWTNKLFTYYWIFIFTVLVLQLFFMENRSVAVMPGPSEYNTILAYWFNVVPGIPVSFRGFQFVLVIIQFALSVYFEIVWEYNIGNDHVKPVSFTAI